MATTGKESTGRVTKLMREKGFGFLREEGGTEYFFHRSAVGAGGFEGLSEGQSVKFTAGTGDKGPRAENVIPLRGLTDSVIDGRV